MPATIVVALGLVKPPLWGKGLKGHSYPVPDPVYEQLSRFRLFGDSKQCLLHLNLLRPPGIAGSSFVNYKVSL